MAVRNLFHLQQCVCWTKRETDKCNNKNKGKTVQNTNGYFFEMLCHGMRIGI